jgi:RNA polymerase sigma factor (sigma-70 family)
MTTMKPRSAAPKSSRKTPARVPLTDELAARYLPRVQRHATRIARKLPRHVQVGDLVSAGFCGLVDAFLRFDPTRMESFEAYIDHRIRGAILDELRHHDPLTRDQRAFVRSVTEARQSFSGREGRLPDERELAAELAPPATATSTSSSGSSSPRSSRATSCPPRRARSAAQVIGCGIFVFPISYIFGDVLTEVYGYARSRRVIWIGFACAALTSGVFYVSRRDAPDPSTGPTRRPSTPSSGSSRGWWPRASRPTWWASSPTASCSRR